MFSRALILLLAVLCLSHAQTVTGTLEGRVLDPTGAAVANASIRVKELSTGVSRVSQSNAEGLYQFAFLALGNYEVVAAVPASRLKPAKPPLPSTALPSLTSV